MNNNNEENSISVNLINLYIYNWYLYKYMITRYTIYLELGIEWDMDSINSPRRKEQLDNCNYHNEEIIIAYQPPQTNG